VFCLIFKTFLLAYKSYTGEFIVTFPYICTRHPFHYSLPSYSDFHIHTCRKFIYCIHLPFPSLFILPLLLLPSP
jgi:hypothetical protein